MRHSARPPGVEMPIGKHLSGSIKIRGVKRRNRPLSESRTGVRGRRLDVRDVDVSYFDPTDFDTPSFALGRVLDEAERDGSSTRPRRPERAYMDILKNVTRSG